MQAPVQDIWFAIWRALPRFRSECSDRTFVYRVAHNCAITHAGRRRVETTELAAAMETAHPAPLIKLSLDAADVMLGMLSEYAVAALLVCFAVWKLMTDDGLSAFVWGFAMLGFTGMALSFSASNRRGLWHPATRYLWPIEVSALIEGTPTMLGLLPAFTVCLTVWSVFMGRHNRTEQHDLERLRRQIVDA